MPSAPALELGFEHFFRDAAVGMAVLDLDGRWQALNDAALAVLALPREALLGRDWRAITHPDDVPVQFSRMQQALAGAQRAFALDVRWRCGDGREARVSLNLSLVRDDDGAPRAFLAQFKDLAERHAADGVRDAFFENAPDLMAIADPRGAVLQVNPAWRTVLGWSPEELKGRGFLELIHPDDIERTREEAARVASGHRTVGFRNRYRTRDGDYRWLEWLSRLGADGLLYGAARDVTAEQDARRAAEDESERRAAELATAQRQLALHAGNSPLAVIEWDAQGRVTRWSARAVELFGWSEAEALGRSLADWRFVHDEDAMRVARVMEQLHSGRSPRNISSNRNYTRSGEVVHCEWFNSALYDDAGQLTSILSQVQDVSEQALTQAALQQSEARFRAAFEQAAVGMAHVDLDGRWMRVNDAMCRLLGYGPSELLAVRFQDVSHPADLDADLALVQRLLAGEIPYYSMEKRYVHRAGHRVWALLTVSLLRDARGEPMHFVAVVEDIGARKAAETELRDAHEQLELRVLQRTLELEQANAGLSREIGQRRRAEAALRDSELRLRSILENSHDAFIAIDEDGRVVEWNAAAETVFGWQREEAIGEPMAALIAPPALRDAHDAGLRRFIATGQARVMGQRVQLRGRHRDGREFPIEVTISEVQLGARRLFTAFLHDISARVAAENRLRDSEARLRTITDNVPALIAYIDPELRYGFINATYRDWFGRDPDACLGLHVSEVLGAQGYASVEPFMRRALAGERVTFQTDFTMRDGEVRHVHLTYIPDFAADGAVKGFHVTASDITAHRRLAQMLEKRAMHDALTGLPNRAAWNEQFERGLARAQRGGSPAVVMFLDLDGFKRINDTHGHEAGDALLREFAQRLSSSVRKSDLVARLAGDEFVVMLENVVDPGNDPAAVAAKILAALETPLQHEGLSLPMSSSIGIAVQRSGRFEPDQLMRVADKAMYRAKQAGAGRFEIAEI